MPATVADETPTEAESEKKTSYKVCVEILVNLSKYALLTWCRFGLRPHLSLFGLLSAYIEPFVSLNLSIIFLLVFVPQSTVRNEQKELNLAPVHHVNVSYATATFGMGCFWGAESLYGATRGVLRTTVGYAGGSSELPTYRKM